MATLTPLSVTEIRYSVKKVSPDVERPSLDEEHRNLTRHRLIEGARLVVVRRGLRATTDEIAEAAGVGRRTVFRHFPTLDELLAEVVASILDDFEPDIYMYPLDGHDVHEWLVDLAVRLHRRSIQDYGQLFWDLNKPDADRPVAIDSLTRTLPARRVRLAEQVVTVAWTAAGGTGAPPAHLAPAFTLLASGFAAHGLAATADPTPEDTGRLAGRMMATILDDAVQRSHEADPRAR